MYYELDLFTKIIELHCNHFTFKVTKPQKNAYLNEIKIDTTDVVIVAEIIRERKVQKLISKKIFSTHHPEYETISNLQLQLISDDISAVLSPKIIKELGIEADAMIYFSYSNTNAHSKFYIRASLNSITLHSAEQLYLEYCILFKGETDRIRGAYRRNVYSNISNLVIDKYVHLQQHAIFCLFAKVDKFLKVSEPQIQGSADEFNLAVLSLARKNLNILLRFIESEFPTLVKKEAEWPISASIIVEPQFQEKVQAIKEHLLNANLDSDLLAILHQLIQKFEYRSEKTMPYYELTYFAFFIESLYSELIINNYIWSADNVIRLLFQCNFNSLKFYSFYLQSKKAEVSQFDEDDAALINTYYLILKTVNQYQLFPNQVYKPQRPSIKFLVKAWLEEEINYLKRRQENTKETKQTKLFTNFEFNKIKVGVSVAQLSYFFRLMKETDIILHKNQRDIFRHIAATYSTENVTEISADSVSTRFYRNESNDIQAVRGLLISMLNKANSEVL